MRLNCFFLLSCVEKSRKDSTRGNYKVLQSTTKVSQNIKNGIIFSYQYSLQKLLSFIVQKIKNDQVLTQPILQRD